MTEEEEIAHDLLLLRESVGRHNLTSKSISEEQKKEGILLSEPVLANNNVSFRVVVNSVPSNRSRCCVSSLARFAMLFETFLSLVSRGRAREREI